MLERLREAYERGFKQAVKEREDRGSLLHQQFTIAVGTVGAIVFAGMVLLLEDPTTFEKPPLPPNYFHIGAVTQFHLIVTGLGLLVVLSVFSVIATSFVGAGMVSHDSWLGWFGYGSGLATMLGLALAVSVILDDVTPTGGNIIFGAYGVLGVMLAFALAYGLWRQRPSS